jgi:hypothetical protein
MKTPCDHFPNTGKSSQQGLFKAREPESPLFFSELVSRISATRLWLKILKKDTHPTRNIGTGTVAGNPPVMRWQIRLSLSGVKVGEGGLRSAATI